MKLFRVTYVRGGCILGEFSEVVCIILAENEEDAFQKAKMYKNKFFSSWYTFVKEIVPDSNGFYIFSEHYGWK